MAQFITRTTFNTSLPKESVVFFGTGIVSLKSLEHIAKSYDIEAVVTLTDRQGSNGRREPSLVKQWAIGHRVKLIEINNRKELTSAFENTQLISSLGIVIDFGIILPMSIISNFRFGVINSHFSLLPKWRGADPITFALLSGEQQTGISIMQVDKGLDTGEVIESRTLNIRENDTSGSLTERLIELSNSTLDEIIPTILSGKAEARLQTGIPTYSRKLLKLDGRLDYRKPAAQLVREIQAYNNWPTSYTDIEEQRVVVIEAESRPYQTERLGMFFLTEDSNLAVACKDSLLIIKNLKPAGKKQMDTASFLAGRQSFRNNLAVI